MHCSQGGDAEPAWKQGFTEEVMPEVGLEEFRVYSYTVRGKRRFRREEVVVVYIRWVRIGSEI